MDHERGHVGVAGGFIDERLLRPLAVVGVVLHLDRGCQDFRRFTNYLFLHSGTILRSGCTSWPALGRQSRGRCGQFIDLNRSMSVEPGSRLKPAPCA
jgi:hypothetical protein